MPKFVRLAVLLGIVLATPQLGWGADHDFPVMNSIGRFWGVGYTRGGYHAAQDGRFDVVTGRHPSSNYRRGGLPQYAQPLYSPPSHSKRVPPVSTNPAVAPKVGDSKTGSDKSKTDTRTEPPTNAKSVPAEVIAPPKPVVPSKPTEPPPRWLEDYLKAEDAAAAGAIPDPQRNLQAKPIAPESSPSDRLLDESQEGSSEEIDLGKEVSFDFFDASYSSGSVGRPIDRRALPPVAPATVAPSRVNRYR